MPQVQLSDRLFKEAQRRAAEGGYRSVDDYFADMLSQDEPVDDSPDETPNLDHLFTPERIAELKRISDRIKAGEKTYTMAEAAEHFQNMRKLWSEEHAT